MSGSIGDQKLMFEQKRLCRNGAYATWPEQLREGDQQVDGEDEEFTHGANATMIASTRKTAQHRRIPSYYEFATHRASSRRRKRFSASIDRRGLSESANMPTRSASNRTTI
jgi:hypothetical protein